MRDIRLAWRSLSRSPGLLAIAIGTLALGIGANTVMFSIVSGVLLRPLPYAQPQNLVQLTEIDRRGSAGPLSYLDVEDWRARCGAFESIIIYGSSGKTLQNVADPERLASVWSDRGLFDMLGVEPAAGRTFRPDDPVNVVVVSTALAKRRLGGVAAAVGRKLILDGEPFTVIGVAPAGFEFPYRGAQTDLWLLWNGPPQTPNRDSQVDSAAARLQRGVSIQAARNRLNAMKGRRTAVLVPLSEAISGRVRPALVTLLGAVGMVLLIACVNVTSLLLARAAGRTHEMAVRIALGASRGRLIRQLLTESILIGTAGGVAGLALARAATDAFVKLAASRIPRSWEIGLDWRVFLFLLAVCLVTGIAFGVAPALAASNVDVQSGLKQGEGARAGASSVRGRRLHDILVVAEIALACVLLVGAGALLQAFLHLQSIPAGLAPDHVLTARIAIALKDYPAPGSFGRYAQEMQQRIQRIPGVRAAGFIQFLPLANWGWKGGFWPDRQAHAETAIAPLAELRYVSPGYFRTLGIPIRQGRDFTDRDTSDTPLVILVNEALARQYFPRSDAVGHATSRGTIVGVVGDVRQSGLDHPASPEIYYTFAQNTAATGDAGVSVVVSTPLPPETLTRILARAIHEVNPNQAIFGIRTMRAVIAESFSDVQLYTWLIGAFAAIALLLAAAGIYGVMSYSVAARKREFGIRMALGADSGNILRLVLRRGAVLVALGLVLGAAGASALARTLHSVVGSAGPVDGVVLVATGIALGVVALGACAAPARRASKLQVLLHE
jgi:putative ABC transport system permease protein